MPLARLLCTAIAVMTLASCATSTTSSSDGGRRALMRVACAWPSPLDDDTFGATSRKLAEFAVALRSCRIAGGLTDGE